MFYRQEFLKSSSTYSELKSQFTESIEILQNETIIINHSIIYPPYEIKIELKGSASFMISMIGIIVMVNGILSKNPDAIPETH